MANIKVCQLQEFLELTQVTLDGARVGFIQDDGFISATWNNEDDCYDTCYEEGDDYYTGVLGIPRMDAYHKQFAKPNMPTHWMEMPTHP